MSEAREARFAPAIAAAVASGPAWSAARARASAAELEAWLRFGQAACDAADAVALDHFRRDLEIMTKPDRSFVTIADQAIERLIREQIRAAYPDHGLVGEEYGSEAGTARCRWYIDPIDGTHNFIRGVPLFGTLLALEVDGELQLGIVSAPALRERWYGGAGERGLSARSGARPPGRSTSRVSLRWPTPRCCTAPPMTSKPPRGRRASGRCSARSGGIVASVTSGAMRCSPKVLQRP